jgi:parvulin-like peptidyl-prolyl isomerase
MSSLLLTPEQEAEAQQLAGLIRQATDDDFLRLARLLVSTDERHTFGQTEFDARDLLLRAGARAYQTFLAKKKTAIEAPASPARAASKRPRSTATERAPR